MKILFIICLMFFMLSFLVMLLAVFFSKKIMSDREKLSPFECGFDPSSSSRLFFSLRFFLIAVIFLIFDVEIVLLLPLILSLSMVSLKVWGLVGITFIIILLAGLYHEWYQGALNWM
nr:NADH dehydrogenase subunit 3 [Diplatys flavicollis]